MGDGGSVFPAPLAEIEEEMLDLWGVYADATGDLPLAASRLNDLLWVRRHGERPAHRARAAFDGYMALAESAETMDLVDCLLRAIEIAAEIKDVDRLAMAIAKALDISWTEIGAAGSDEEHDRVDLAKHEAMQIRIWALVGVEILEAVKRAFGVPEREALTEYFTTELIDREVASRIADGVLRFSTATTTARFIFLFLSWRRRSEARLPERGSSSSRRHTVERQVESGRLVGFSPISKGGLMSPGADIWSIL
jgi:hypothetical protein